MFIRIILISILFISFSQSETIIERLYNKRFYQFDHIFKRYAKEYNIPFLLLKAIALTENAPLNPYLIGNNKNGTQDIGLMQINTIHLDKFGIKKKYLLNPEISVHAASILLSNLIKKHGYSWDSIGRYHSKTMKYKRKWVNKVKENIKLIVKYDKKYNYKNALYKK